MTLDTLNHKQQELARQLFETVHEQFPETEFLFFRVALKLKT